MADKDAKNQSDSEDSVVVLSLSTHSSSSEKSLLQGDDIYMVERLVGKRKNPETGVIEYRVKWDGYPSSDNTWEPKKNLQCYDLIQDFEARELEKSKRKEKKNQELIESKIQRKLAAREERRLKDEERIKKIKQDEQEEKRLQDQERIKKLKQAEQDGKLRLKDKVLERFEKIKQRKQAEQEEKRLKEKISKNSSTVVTEPIHVPGFEKNYTVEKIIGACRVGDVLKYLVKFQEDDEPELVNNSICHEKCPQDLIAHLERTLAWSTVFARD